MSLHIALIFFIYPVVTDVPQRFFGNANIIFLLVFSA